MKKIEQPIFPLIVKFLLGALFIFSAISKLVSLDLFEIYVFSFHFANLGLSMWAARILIAAELGIGIGFIANCWHKLFWWGNMALMIGFCGILIYSIFIGRTDSCHCFGEILPFNPPQSLIKNAVIIGLCLITYKVKSFNYRFPLVIVGAITVISLATVFIVSPPDNVMKKFRGQSDKLNVELFQETIVSNDSLNLDEGKKIVCLYSTKCRFCQMASHKLSIMQEYYDFPGENVYNYFWGTEEGVEAFYQLSESHRYQHIIIDPKTMIDITMGRMPTIVFLNNGEIELQYGYRNMEEKPIKKFMKE